MHRKMAWSLDIVRCLLLLSALGQAISEFWEPPSLEVVESKQKISVTLSPDHGNSRSVVLLVSQSASGNCSLQEATEVERIGLRAGEVIADFDTDGLAPGNYCAVVEADGRKIAASNFVEVVEHERSERKVADCSDWNATISLTASPITRKVDVETHVLTDPGCSNYDVILWQLIDETYGSACTHGIDRVERVMLEFSKLTHVTFENMTAGNYCVRITPRCPAFDGCLTLYSKMVELPEIASRDKDYVAPGGWMNGTYLLLLLLPVGLLTAFICLLYHQRWRHVQDISLSSVQNGLPFKDVDSNPVIKVVYSRDSAQHNEAVACLCRFLETEAEVRVVYDENAQACFHLTTDWAIDMADVYCPLFSPESSKSSSIEKILVIESDGGIIKQDAHHDYKDVGLASTDFMDELYHITYNALLSRQAQALGDYCHIFVARFCYTTSPSRLHLVPEKRYLLPQHTKELLSALLHTGSSKERDPEALGRMLDSELYRRLLLVIDNMKNSLEENPDLIKDKLRTIIVNR